MLPAARAAKRAGALPDIRAHARSCAHNRIKKQRSRAQKRRSPRICAF